MRSVSQRIVVPEVRWCTDRSAHDTSRRRGRLLQPPPVLSATVEKRVDRIPPGRKQEHRTMGVKECEAPYSHENGVSPALLNVMGPTGIRNLLLLPGI